MEQTNVWKCSFCKKTSFHKGTIRTHEKKCFYNPATHSCATCLWFSPLILNSGYPVECYLGRIEEVPEGTRVKLETQCEKWVNVAVAENIDILEVQNKEVLNLLIKGKEELLSVIGDS